MPVPEKDSSLSKNAIKAELVLAEEKGETLTISNTGEATLDFSLSAEGEIKDFLSFSDNGFSLDGGGKRYHKPELHGKKGWSFHRAGRG